MSLLDRVQTVFCSEDLVDVDGNVVYPEGTVVTQEVSDTIKPILEAGAHTRELQTNLD